MSTDHPKSAQAHSAEYSDKRRTLAMAVVAFGFIMDLLDSTIVNIAIPSIQTNLGATYTTIQWLVSGYLLTFALLLLTGGRLGDVVGYKKIFMIGVGGFTIASFLCGIASTSEMLIVARLIQGAMAALMVPQVMSLMQVMYKPEERGGISGLFGALAGLAATAGPIIGGLLIRANILGWDWRPVFLINVPVGIIVLIASYRLLPSGKSPHPLKLDWVGTFLSMIAISLLVYPLIQGRELSWPIWTYLMMAASIPFFIAFWFYEKRRIATQGSALIDTSVFQFRSFNAGISINIIFEMAMVGMFFIFGLLLQIGLGYSVLKAALTGIPIAIGISVSIAALGQQLIPKLGRYVMTIGTVIMGAALTGETLLVTHYGTSLNPWILAPVLLVTGTGMGLIMAPMFSVVLTDVDARHAGAASGVLSALQQVGGAVGVALIGTLFFGQLGNQAYASFDAATPALRQQLTEQHLPEAAQDQIVAGARTCFHDRSSESNSSTLPDSCLQTGGGADDSAIGDIITKSALDANARNFAGAFRYGVYYELALLVLVFGLSFLLPRKFKVQAE